jgi:methylated-DNA-protein-cysteine methyltransferase-like protein
VTGFRQRVEAVVAGLGDGEVVTYGEVAAQAGSPGAARAVGGVLRTTALALPWWRVVGAGGQLVSPDAQLQAGHLAAEGVVVVDGYVATRTGGTAGERRGR